MVVVGATARLVDWGRDLCMQLQVGHECPLLPMGAPAHLGWLSCAPGVMGGPAAPGAGS